MKTKLIFLIATLTLVSCQSDIEEKIETHLKSKAMGLEINYKSQSFQWVDTLTVSELNDSFKRKTNGIIEPILGFEYYIYPHHDHCQILTKSYNSISKLKQLRNFENEHGHKENGDYIAFAKKNYGLSSFINSYADNIDGLDSIISNYDNFKESDPFWIKTLAWFYKRTESYEKNHVTADFWDLAIQYSDTIKAYNDSISKYSNIDGSTPIYFKGINKYTIENPLLKGAKQELKGFIYFNPELEIIRSEINFN